jgi:hypothetical protein
VKAVRLRFARACSSIASIDAILKGRQAGRQAGGTFLVSGLLNCTATAQLHRRIQWDGGLRNSMIGFAAPDVVEVHVPGLQRLVEGVELAVVHRAVEGQAQGEHAGHSRAGTVS